MEYMQILFYYYITMENIFRIYYHQMSIDKRKTIGIYHCFFVVLL